MELSRKGIIVIAGLFLVIVGGAGLAVAKGLTPFYHKPSPGKAVDTVKPVSGTPDLTPVNGNSGAIKGSYVYGSGSLAIFLQVDTASGGAATLELTSDSGDTSYTAKVQKISTGFKLDTGDATSQLGSSVFVIALDNSDVSFSYPSASGKTETVKLHSGTHDEFSTLVQKITTADTQDSKNIGNSDTASANYILATSLVKQIGATTFTAQLAKMQDTVKSMDESANLLTSVAGKSGPTSDDISKAQDIESAIQMKYATLKQQTADLNSQINSANTLVARLKSVLANLGKAQQSAVSQDSMQALKTDSDSALTKLNGSVTAAQEQGASLNADSTKISDSAQTVLLKMVNG